ncbi:MAG: DUF2520 domain-containing protein [Solirubrobacterales bacterium]|nr:DUF2520 domain-containing protein [Solirubrobacterales bacterium]
MVTREPGVTGPRVGRLRGTPRPQPGRGRPAGSPGTPVTPTRSRLASPVRDPQRDPPTPVDPHGATLPALAIIGRGRLGTALARAAAGAGLRSRLAGREDAIDAGRGSEAALLCVPDEAIPEAAANVVAAIPPLELVGHTSGATGLDALDAAVEAGASAFSLHPLQTVPDAKADLGGAACAIAGSDPRALEFARRLAERLGLRPFELAEEHRAAYHAAASIASNFLVALEESAAGLLAATGVSEPRELLAPLVLRSAANWSERGREALTGPIARGDAATVERHLDALRESAPELVALYEALAERTRELAGDGTGARAEPHDGTGAATATGAGVPSDEGSR